MHFTAYILDVLIDSVYPAEITIENGIFEQVEPIFPNEEAEIDVEGVLLPGFIDAHIHIESSMVTPAQFAKIAVRHGTTGVVADPHEIANVWGIEGVEFMIDNASKVPFNFYFAAPSCVPATPFETSGAVLDSSAIEYLLKKDEIVALGEMMNFPGVLKDDPEVLRKLELARKYRKPVDGHAPMLTGKLLDKYIGAGISTDHECSGFKEAIEKKRKGMKIMVRDGSSAKDMEDILDITEREKYHITQNKFGMIAKKMLVGRLSAPIFDFIVSDDKHPQDLIRGHLNMSIKKAVNFGIDVLKAIEMVTVNPSRHYRLPGGVIQEGEKADFVVIDNFDDFNVLKTFIDGECVFDGENVLFDVPDIEIHNSVNATPKTEDDFEIPFDGDACNVNVIQCFDGDLLTDMGSANLQVENGHIQPDIPGDVLKIAVVERYGKNHVANAFIKGFGLEKGAIASSIAHDSHNIIVVGCDAKMMAEAVNTVIDNMGGIAVVDEDFNESLALPIAGLMTNEDAILVAERLETLHKRASDLGCKLDSPFMTMAFMALLVIPSIKISDLGLFDGNKFKLIDVIKN